MKNYEQGSTISGGPVVHPPIYHVYDKIVSTKTINLRSQSDDYRFGFNGMEKDNEVKGTGNSLDFGARIYDSRLGRWASLDPLQAKYPSLSPYNFTANNPIVLVDPDGRDIKGFLERVKEFFLGMVRMDIADDKIVEYEYAHKIVNEAQPYAEGAISASKTLSSFMPGVSSYYEIHDGNYAMAGIYGVVDLFGGSIVKGASKQLAKAVGSDALNATGKMVMEAIENVPSIKNSFDGGNYKMMEALEDMIVYRFSGGNSTKEAGSFFSLSSAKNAEEANKMLNIWKWGNTRWEVTPVTIKKGTQFGVGNVSGGYGTQVFIPETLQKSNVVRHVDKTKQLAPGNLLKSGEKKNATKQLECPKN